MGVFSFTKIYYFKQSKKIRVSEIFIVPKSHCFVYFGAFRPKSFSIILIWHQKLQFLLPSKSKIATIRRNGKKSIDRQIYLEVATLLTALFCLKTSEKKVEKEKFNFNTTRQLKGHDMLFFEQTTEKVQFRFLLSFSRYETATFCICYTLQLPKFVVFGPEKSEIFLDFLLLRMIFCWADSHIESQVMIYGFRKANGTGGQRQIGQFIQ